MDKPLLIGDIPTKFDRRYRTRDRERKDVSYDVNIARLTCTCDDFRRRRGHLSERDARRVCAHLYDKLYQTKVEQTFEPLVQLFIRYGREMLAYQSVDDAAGRCVVGLPFGDRQVRVIGVIRGKPILATYDCQTESWAGSETPLGTEEARAVIQRMRTAYPELFRQ